MSKQKDHVFELTKLLAIKDRQLYEANLLLKQLKKEYEILKTENQKYKSTNFLLRQSIETIEEKHKGICAGCLMEGYNLIT